VGLIGGSIGLALRDRAGARVRGFDPDGEVLARALELGVLDETAPELAGAVEGAQAVFVAAPVGALADATRAALAASGPDCVVSDVGSTKRALAELELDRRFIGGHPLAGAETAGVEHARGNLFERATWYLTPRPGTASELYERLRGLIVAMGARPESIDPEAHDRLMATVSHLPHVLANVLVAQAARAAPARGAAAGAGPGAAAGPSFRDATRVAGANNAIWTDIYLANRAALLEAIDDTSNRLAAVRELIAAGEPRPLAAWIEAARADRERLVGSEGPIDRKRPPGREGSGGRATRLDS